MNASGEAGPSVRSSTGIAFDARCDVLVIGAGAAGLIAALRAHEAGASVLVLERDAVPRGSTALSAGLIPAAGTRFQRAAGIDDDPARFAADIMDKAHGEPDAASVDCIVEYVAEALEWLADRHGLPFSVINDFDYPGHSVRRMHGLPSRSGAELMDCLRAAAEVQGIDIITSAVATTLFCDSGRRVAGVGLVRPDGSADRIGCKALILACNGYGGNRQLVSSHLPEMSEALYFGHPGNQGEALLWGQALGASTRHLSGHQGHGSVAHPHGILITWATMTEGGFQVNLAGERFANEALGYSETAATVLCQPHGAAWSIFDGRVAKIARQFEDFRQAEAAGAVLSAETFGRLEALMHLPAGSLERTGATVALMKDQGETDAFGRIWTGVSQLLPPFHAVRVTGALFHTQGGLCVDNSGRVRELSGVPLPNLFAAGGAACGVSGARASGYLSGNGLLTAVSYGYISGRAAAAI